MRAWVGAARHLIGAPSGPLDALIGALYRGVLTRIWDAVCAIWGQIFARFIVYFSDRYFADMLLMIFPRGRTYTSDEVHMANRNWKFRSISKSRADIDMPTTATVH